MSQFDITERQKEAYQIVQNAIMALPGICDLVRRQTARALKAEWIPAEIRERNNWTFADWLAEADRVLKQ